MGKGSFGTVVKAQNRVTGQVVAIKHISNAFANIESAKQVFREITILR
jgi:serine/threonine protein kinase